MMVSKNMMSKDIKMDNDFMITHTYQSGLKAWIVDSGVIIIQVSDHIGECRIRLFPEGANQLFRIVSDLRDKQKEIFAKINETEILEIREYDGEYD